MTTAVGAICKPFTVKGQEVSREQIVAVVNRLASIPDQFIAMDLVAPVLPGASFHDKQEALNRLFQRWRKLGLMKFKKGRWSLTKGAWSTMQDATRRSSER